LGIPYCSTAPCRKKSLNPNVKTISSTLGLCPQAGEIIDSKTNGNFAKREVGEKGKPSIGDRMFAVYRGIERATYGPTATHKVQMALIDKQINTTKTKLQTINDQLNGIYQKLKAAGAPLVEE